MKNNTAPTRPDEAADDLYCLTALPEGTTARIDHIESGRALLGRLTEMGILPGTLVTVIFSRTHGPLILARGHDRLALGQGAASNIYVSLPDEKEL